MTGWIVGGIVFVVLLWWKFHRAGNPGFWALTRKHPAAAIHLFHTDPAWIVHSGPAESLPGGKAGWVGPFRVLDPLSNNLVKVYGKTGEMDASEARFMESLQQKT